MKKLTALLLSLTLVFSLTACGEDRGKNEIVTFEPAMETIEQETVQAPSEQPTEAATAAPTEETGGKTLVVYYSATGNTEEVAGFIAAATDADTFELVPVEPYTSADLDWTKRDSRVSREHDDPSLRTVALVQSTVADWESYDTVFVGYPIWWGIAAWPVDGFIAANDFTGKTVIPFCTSFSSDLGESGELLAKAAGTGNWLEGQRFRSGVPEENVKSWVKDLGL